MKFSAVAVAALVAGASAHYNDTVPVYTTEVVTAYTTYCPAPTQITHGTKTYTVTEATTLTITDCPCTVTKPIYSSSVVHCYTCTPAPSLPPVVSTPGPYPNATAPVPSAPPVASTPSAGPPASTPVASSPPIATGAAAKAFAASGAGLAGAFGVLAYLL